jgi:hypothetical protein
VRDGLEALLRMTTLARLKGAGRVEAVATSAVREAANGDEFLDQVRALTGVEVRKLTGAQEGALVFRAVRHAVDLGRGWTVLVDVGGSTEWCTALTVSCAPCAASSSVAALRGPARRRPPSGAAIEKLRRGSGSASPGAAAGGLRLRARAAACCGDWPTTSGRERLTVGGLRELRAGARWPWPVEHAGGADRRSAAGGCSRAPPRSWPGVLLEELAPRRRRSPHLCDRALRGPPARGAGRCRRTVGRAQRRRRQVAEPPSARRR